MAGALRWSAGFGMGIHGLQPGAPLSQDVSRNFIRGWIEISILRPADPVSSSANAATRLSYTILADSTRALTGCGAGISSEGLVLIS